MDHVSAPLLRQASFAGTAHTNGNYVRRSILRPPLNWALSQLGDRLEKRGKERTAASGTIQYDNQETSQGVILLNEFPDVCASA
jgi:hypothetical protein